MTLFIAYEAVTFIANLRKTEQARLRDRFLQIRDSPSYWSDYCESDSEGHSVEITIVGRFAIRYWIDHADRHIKILEVLLADRRRSST